MSDNDCTPECKLEKDAMRKREEALVMLFEGKPTLWNLELSIKNGTLDIRAVVDPDGDQGGANRARRSSAELPAWRRWRVPTQLPRAGKARSRWPNRARRSGSASRSSSRAADHLTRSDKTLKLRSSSCKTGSKTDHMSGDVCAKRDDLIAGLLPTERAR